LVDWNLRYAFWYDIFKGSYSGIKVLLKRRRMKSTILALFFLFFVLEPAFNQEDFKVIKVNGTILLKTRGVSLETGTVFSAKEDLLFRSDDAAAAVINSQKGRVVITSKNHDLSSARSNYLPSMYNISSRGGLMLTIADLSSHFSGKYVILDREDIELDKASFPMNAENFFFLRYKYKGEEINKKLGFKGDTLIIDKAALFTIDGNPIPSADNTKIKLFYRRSNESVFISEFDLIFPDMNQLARETEVILNELNGKSADVKISETGSYINEFYGKVSPECLKKWLSVTFGVK
jgi:hypothetical protein